MLNNVIVDMGVKHVSFDFWNTLASGNPDFAQARGLYLQMLANDFGEKKLTYNQARLTYTDTKTHFDTMAEATGLSTPTVAIIMYLMKKLGVYQDKNFRRQEAFALNVQTKLNELFQAYPPIIRPETVDLLDEIAATGLTISIGSNTNFITGSVISHILGSYQLPWRFHLFSDAWQYSKPHPNFFRRIAEFAMIDQKDILHIGDHPICDGAAVDNGFKGLLIKSPTNLIQVLTK